MIAINWKQYNLATDTYSISPSFSLAVLLKHPFVFSTNATHSLWKFE